MRQRWLALALALAALAVAGSGVGCKERPDDGTTPQAAVADLPALELRDDTPNLMLTWLDDRGEAHVELRPGDVPAEGRAMVRAVLSDREDGTRDVFYVADLTQRGPDGAYAVKSMRRRDWEAQIAQRRDAYLAKTAPPPPPAPAGTDAAAPGSPAARPDPGGLTVIIYGASWCRPCHDAESYLHAKGVAVVMKDIEESQAAAAEMREKLEKSHQRGGSIPILDVRGQILVGFNPSALDRAVARAASGTAL